jgi:hypothetical protein
MAASNGSVQVDFPNWALQEMIAASWLSFTLSQLTAPLPDCCKINFTNYAPAGVLSEI